MIPANMLLTQMMLTPYTYRFLNRHYVYADMQQFTYGKLSQYS